VVVCAVNALSSIVRTSLGLHCTALILVHHIINSLPSCVCATAPSHCTPNRSYDGYRQKQWCVSSAQYGVRWRARDVVGVYLDADLLEMRFFVNGQDLGTAFAGYQVL
jgi:SPRY domain